MTRPHVPQEVLDAAHARRAARQAQDWAEADRLKAVIEAAGWQVVDRGGDFALSPLHPADVVEAGRTRYGWSGAVLSRLAESATAPATVVAVVDGGADDSEGLAAVARARSLHAAAPEGTQLVLVVAGAGGAAEAALAAAGGAAGPAAEAVWIAGPASHGAGWNAGIRRAAGDIVILAGPGVRATGDAISPLLAALRDPGVAVAGAMPLVGRSVQDLEVGEPAGLAVAVDDTLIAFRRADAARLTPLDERFRSPRLLAAWWSLALRDGEPSPRAAVAVGGLPIRREVAPDAADDAGDLDAAGRERLIRRDRYRLLDAFRGREDLLAIGPRG